MKHQLSVDAKNATTDFNNYRYVQNLLIPIIGTIFAYRTTIMHILHITTQNKPTETMTTETPILNEHKQSCGSASAEDKRACIMPSPSKFAAGKTEYPPMHKGNFDASQINI